MKVPKLMLALLFTLALASCSSKKSSNDAQSGIEGSEIGSIEFKDAENIHDIDIALEESLDAGTNVKGVEENDRENQDLMVVDLPENKKTLIEGNFGEYRIKRGETLMQVAFKIYGDINKWKDIKSLNPHLSHGKLKFGSKLKYQVPDKAFEYLPSGTPYLVMRGDTLSTISEKVYDHANWWPHIYENNKPMIKDPNQIFAGFTLYYLPENQIEQKRQLASQ